MSESQHAVEASGSASVAVAECDRKNPQMSSNNHGSSSTSKPTSLTTSKRLAHPVEPRQLHHGDIVQQLAASLSSIPASVPGPVVAASSHTASSSTTTTVATTNSTVIKGRNASGRTWKVRPQRRASTLIKSRVNGATKNWDQRQTERHARAETTALQTELQTAKRDAILAKRERKLAQDKRRAENELAAMQRNAQALNPKRASQTLKSLSKKQLRQVKKTRLNPKTGVVEYVSAYAK